MLALLFFSAFQFSPAPAPISAFQISAFQLLNRLALLAQVGTFSGNALDAPPLRAYE
jgi:hypothetical protein